MFSSIPTSEIIMAVLWLFNIPKPLTPCKKLILRWNFVKWQRFFEFIERMPGEYMKHLMKFAAFCGRKLSDQAIAHAPISGGSNVIRK